MKTITLGKTGIRTPQNAFGALPIQRISRQEAVRLLRMAHDGGMTFFDTARAYTDSEEKVGEAFDGIRDRVFIASKTMAVTPEGFWDQLHTTLKNLRTDYLDAQIIYSIRLYCYGTLGMTREWLLQDNITPAETAVEMMFDSMPERLKDIFF